MVSEHFFRGRYISNPEVFIVWSATRKPLQEIECGPTAAADYRLNIFTAPIIKNGKAIEIKTLID